MRGVVGTSHFGTWGLVAPYCDKSSGFILYPKKPRNSLFLKTLHIGTEGKVTAQKYEEDHL
jgi:hypothetical protein